MSKIAHKASIIDNLLVPSEFLTESHGLRYNELWMHWAILDAGHLKGNPLGVEYPRALQRQFEQAIIEGHHAPGDVVTISDLAAEYQVSLPQIEQIVQTAHRKGLVDQVTQEEGVFRILGLPTTSFASVFTHTANSGLRPRSVVRDVEVEPATQRVADKLEVDAGNPVFRYVRTRYVNEQALANQTNFMPFAVCPGLEEDDVSRYSFQKLLEEKYYAVLMEMKEWFRLVPATTEDQEILGLPRASQVLVIERIALSATGWPLVWANIRIRPDRYEYVSALWPQAAHLLEDTGS
jgi:GntR family transcriptional regulator